MISTSARDWKVGKIHLRNLTTTIEDYPNSPHVINAIKNGNLSICALITERITSDIREVTCKGCLKIMFTIGKLTSTLP